MNGVARWDGVAWSALSGPEGEGVDGFVQDLVTFEDAGGPALYVGGSFTTAGGLPSARVAAWRCAGAIFADGFESGTMAGWSDTVP